MKRVLLSIMLLVILLPIVVSAKTIEVTSPFGIWEEFDPFIEPGDTITFNYDRCSEYFYRLAYNDNYLTNDYYTREGCSPKSTASSYTFNKKMLATSLVYSYVNSIGYVHTLNFYDYDENANVYKASDITEDDYFKSGDIIILNEENGYSNLYFYDKNKDLLEEVGTNDDEKYFSYVIPKKDGKDVYWRVEIFNDGMYGSEICPHFYEIDYVEPSFSLICDDKVIKYGQKTTCHLYVTSMYNMKNVAFDMDLPSFKISNVNVPNKVEMVNGSKNYNLKLDNKYADNGKEVLLMSFSLEGTKNENYTDGVNVIDIQYKDSIIEGTSNSVDSNLQILPNILTNPKTLTNLMYILLPIIVLIILLVLNKVNERRAIQGKRYLF